MKTNYLLYKSIRDELQRSGLKPDRLVCKKLVLTIQNSYNFGVLDGTLRVVETIPSIYQAKEV